MFKLALKISSLVLMLMLASCVNQPPTSSSKTRVTSLSNLDHKARTHHTNSANKYLRLAESTNDIILKNYNILQASNSFIDAFEFDKARQTLDSIGELQANSDNYYFQIILKSRMLNKLQNTSQAESILKEIWIPDDLPNHLQKLYFITKAEIKEKQGLVLDALNSRLKLTQLLHGQEENRDNNLDIWKLLSNLTPSDLTTILDNPSLPRELKGWVSMARLSRQYEYEPSQIDRAMSVWQQEFPEHPAYNEIYGDWFEDTTKAAIPYDPNHIALILPLSDPDYGQGAKAIRDGFLAKHYQNKKVNNYSPKISFFDTGKMSVVDAFDKAKQDGVDIIIGPLLKENLKTLVQSRRLDIPVLALNTLQSHYPPKNLYQFGLSPEFEAESVVSKATRDGHRYAIAIVPDNDWGQRIKVAFENSWLNSGGIILDTITFSDINDVNNKIQNILGVKDSKDRISTLKNMGLKLDATPRRRQDIDFIFVAANPTMARQIKPLLNFHYANNLPIYASSSIYEGFEQSSKDQDLNGITFCDMPWVLDDSIKSKSLYLQIAKIWPDHIKKHPRLVALGIDAYKISTQLNQLISRPHLGISGMTGMLYIEPNRQISRDLLWAKVTKGSPRMISNQH